MNQKQDYIAVFDSGVGGISVLRALTKVMPAERYVYFGDSANAPYGTRTAEDVRRLTESAVAQLLPLGLKALVVACNTATAAAIDHLRKLHPQLIVVGVEPALKPACRDFPGGTVGVLATPVTLREEKFAHLASLCRRDCTVISLPAPGLAELVEQGKADSAEARALLSPLLTPHRGNMDALVLGCTHYPFAKTVIQELIGPDTRLYDGADGTARETRRRLEVADLLQEGNLSIRWENSGDQTMLALSQALFEQTQP